ncbi:MAG: hypothetical protein KGH83_01645, partial [Thaumarchaeota archaeon]|nr:hypothetical protein [Nitrososphaerota archaeon]
VPPFANGMSSSLVIGQPDFLSYQPNNGNDTPSANSLNSPSGISFDSKDNLFVADMMNDRILEYTNFQAPEFQFSTQVLLISMISLFIIYKLKFRYP